MNFKTIVLKLLCNYQSLYSKKIIMQYDKNLCCILPSNRMRIMKYQVITAIH